MTHSPLIAVVDDDAGMRRSLDGLIRSLGYRAMAFESAEAFLSSAAAGEARCVLSDLHMPGMNGLALAQRVPPRLSGKVILLSAMLDDRGRQEATAAGVRYFLRKPFDVDELIAAVDAVVGGPTASR